MKIAIVHDYIKEYGGAERVLETLKEIYPDADVFTIVYLPEFLGPHRERFKDWKIKTSFAQYLPFKQKLISPLRLLAPILFKTFNFSQYDVIITSATGAYFPNVVGKKNIARSTWEVEKNSHAPQSTRHNPLLICYCHTPPRYLYGYPTARNLSNNKFIKILTAVANHFLRIVDYRSAQNVDQFIANSNEVSSRIKKFYRKDAVVIYPPVVVSRKSQVVSDKPTTNDLRPKTYFLAGGRLARPKHIDLIVKACAELNVPLKIFGKSFAGYGEELQKLAGSTIEFLGEVSDEQKWELMQNAKAFIFSAEDEDFGIVPVEAMAAGTPVIAYRSGGVKETVIDGKTGLFFDELSVDSLVDAIKKFETLRQAQGSKLSENCKKRASEFSKEKFKKEIVRVVELTLNAK